MPKFKILKEGNNEQLLTEVRNKVENYIQDLFEDWEIAQFDGIYSFTFGTVSVEIRIVPWHSEDVLVNVYSYLAEEVTFSEELMDELLHLNASIPFGSFGISFDSIIFSYALAGANLDENEFSAAVQTVATIADDYDERVINLSEKAQAAKVQ